MKLNQKSMYLYMYLYVGCNDNNTYNLSPCPQLTSIDKLSACLPLLYVLCNVGAVLTVDVICLFPVNQHPVALHSDSQTQRTATRQRLGAFSFVPVTSSSCCQPTRRRGEKNYCCAAPLTAASIVLLASSAEGCDESSPYGHTDISQP